MRLLAPECVCPRYKCDQLSLRGYSFAPKWCRVHTSAKALVPSSSNKPNQYQSLCPCFILNLKPPITVHRNLRLGRICNCTQQQDQGNSTVGSGKLNGRIRKAQQKDQENSMEGSGKTQRKDQENSTAGSGKLNSRIRETQQQDQGNSTAGSRKLNNRIRKTQQQDQGDSAAGSGKLNSRIRETQQQDQGDSTAGSRKLNSRIRETQLQDQGNFKQMTQQRLN